MNEIQNIALELLKRHFNKLSRGLAGEFNTNIQNAEADEVNNYKKQSIKWIHGKPWIDLQVSRNKDEIKACLLRLSELGAIDWTDERIWRALEGLQNVARFVPSDADNKFHFEQNSTVPVALFGMQTFSQVPNEKQIIH